MTQLLWGISFGVPPVLSKIANVSCNIYQNSIHVGASSFRVEDRDLVFFRNTVKSQKTAVSVIIACLQDDIFVHLTTQSPSDYEEAT
jgi:hypothetical protein